MKYISYKDKFNLANRYLPVNPNWEVLLEYGNDALDWLPALLSSGYTSNKLFAPTDIDMFSDTLFEIVKSVIILPA